MGFGITQEMSDAMALTAGVLARIALQGLVSGQPDGKWAKIGKLSIDVGEMLETLVDTGNAPAPTYQKEAIN